MTNKVIVADTGYWFALFDAQDSFHSQANSKADYIESMTVVFPWPILYETLNTRFVKNRLRIDRFKRVVKRPNVWHIDDVPYRDAAIMDTLRLASEGKRSISLTDMVIRLMLADVNLKIDALLTFNVRDFIDVCKRGQIEIL